VILQRGDGDGTAMLTIDDNGTGIGEGGATGRGLTLVLRVVEEVGGTLERLSQAGTTWFITFPVLRTP
jgi:two-component sensor histidine kinase